MISALIYTLVAALGSIEKAQQEAINNMASLTGKVAIVTGASRGIGAAIAERLGRDGASVVVNYAQGADKAKALVSTIEATGSKAIAVQADISQIDDIERLFRQTIETFGHVDILVNNAGTILYKLIAETTESDFDQIFATNVKGTFFTCQRATQYLTEGGRIINMSSTTTALMMPTYGVYAATKGAVEQITRVLAKELGVRGITVNSVSPGATDTELFSLNKTEEEKQQFAKVPALGRLGNVHDIADVIAFVASDQARWITGQIIRVNGGAA